jgi:hypothetical protein
VKSTEQNILFLDIGRYYNSGDSFFSKLDNVADESSVEHLQIKCELEKNQLGRKGESCKILSRKQR